MEFGWKHILETSELSNYEDKLELREEAFLIMVLPFNFPILVFFLFCQMGTLWPFDHCEDVLVVILTFLENGNI